MSENTRQCIACGQSDEQVPLLPVIFAGNEYYICPGDLPVLIHHPDQLSGKLPGAANLTPHQH